MRPTEIGAFQAKTHLSELLEKVERGQIFRITRRGKPVAELRPVVAPEKRPRFGCDKGRVKIESGFDAPLKDMLNYTA